MGVTRRSNAALTPIKIGNENEFNHEDYDLSESGDEEGHHARRISIERINPVRSRFSKEKKCPRSSQRFHEEIDTDGVNVKKNMGARKWRRVEHARILLTFTELEDICEDGSDIFQQPYSAFDKLFADRQNMKIWNDFTEKEEVEQWRILNEEPEYDAAEKQSGSGWCLLGKSAQNKKVQSKLRSDGDRRKHHPAYTGKSCFERIDARSRSALLGRKVNWALVDHLETELRDLFTKNSHIGSGDDEVVFVAHYPASSDRLIAHIVSQYLWLNSQSVTNPETKDRITEIRNPRVFFIPPHVTLLQYLEDAVFKKKIDFIPYSLRDAEKENDAAEDSLINNINELTIATGSNSGSDEEWEKLTQTRMTDNQT